MAKDPKTGAKAAGSKSVKPVKAVKSSVIHARTGANIKKDSSGNYASKGQVDTIGSKAATVGKLTHLRPELEPRISDPAPVANEPDIDENQYRPQIESDLAETAARLKEIERLQAQNRVAEATQQATLDRIGALLEEIKAAA